VAVHVTSNVPQSNDETHTNEWLSIALPLRPEILNLLRQRITLNRIRPTF
jgi:hypothetical protein